MVSMRAVRRASRLTSAAALASAAAVALAACSSSGSGTGGSSNGGTNQVIKIGTISDLSGPASSIGLPGEKGEKLAVAIINAHAKTYLGSGDRSLSLTYSDATNSVSTALTLARNYITDSGTLGILGPMYVAQAESMAPLTSASKITLFVPFANGTTDLTKDSDYVFDSSQPNQGSIQAAIDALQKKWPTDKKIGIIFESDSAAQIPGAAAAASYIQSKGMTPVKCGIPTSSQDFSSCIATMKSSGAQAIYIWNTAPADVAAMQQAASDNYHPNWVGYSNMFDPSVSASGGTEAEGAIMTSDYNPNLETPQTKLFQSSYQSTYQSAPDSWAALGYQAVMTLASAIRSVSGTITRTNLRDALVNVDAASITGSGTFKFDPHTRLEATLPAVLTIAGGKFETLPQS